MNKNIKKAFGKGKAFIPFITCGNPSLAVTERIVYAMEEAGADLIELGIPFSDPTAEGPVIQAANVRALSGGVTTDKIFDLVRRIRQKTSIPMVFMTYANVVYSYGTERFAKVAAEIGMDGLILPDVPFEEKEEFAIPFKEHGLDLISLIATTSHERIAMIAKEAEGFGISEPKSRLCPTHFHICERDEGRNPVERTCVENGKICERPGAEQTRRFCNIYYERLFTEKSVRCIRVER